ncbi:TetR/AcrR family transcriptional regulator [Nocardiopsis oceani]
MVHNASQPGRPRSSEADRSILEAASDLMIEYGIAGVSIDRVARRAGVTRPTVYRRYSGKTELLIAAIHRAFRYQPEELPEPRDIEEMLRWWAHAIEGPENARTRQLVVRLMFAIRDHPEFVETFHKLSTEPRNAMIRSVLKREKEHGRFPDDTDLEIVRQILTGAVALHLTTHPEGSTVRQAEQHFLAVLRETRFRPRGREPQVRDRPTTDT